MNTRIEQLTRTYLDSLNLSYGEQLDSNQKRKIININSQSEWIIFNAGSLEAKRTGSSGYNDLIVVNEENRILVNSRFWNIGDYMTQIRNEIGLVGNYEVREQRGMRIVYGYLRREDGTVPTEPTPLVHPGRDQDQGFSNETYDIFSSTELKAMFKETVKVYNQDNLNFNEVEFNTLYFVGGGGIDYIGGHNYTKAAIPTDYFNGKGESYYWIVINKKECGERFDDSINTTILSYSPKHWKIVNHYRLENLLNNNEITNSRGRSEPASPPSNTTRTTPPPSPNNAQPNPNSSSAPTTQTIQFKIKNVDRFVVDVNLFFIEPDSPITVNGKQVTSINLTGRKADIAYQNGILQAGKTITITNVRFAPMQAEINAHNELSIGRHYDDIQNAFSSTTSSFTPTPNSPPSHYPEVQRKNQKLNQEGNDFDLLVEELLKIIEKNQKICQEAQNYGLNLPKLPADTLEFFETDSFALLDDTQPLNSSHNSQITADNEQIRRKKMNIKKNIYGIYENNKKKLTEAKTGQKPPKNELEQLKEEVKEKINKVLTDKDNLRNINLTTLENGKYQNWEKDIEQLISSEQLVTYVEAFLKVLRATGAKEKEKEQTKKSLPPISSPNSPKNKENDVIDDNTQKAINSLPLAAAKNLAKTKIRELFNKYNPQLETLKKIWGGEQNWMAYLEKCNNPKEVIEFLKKLEQAIISQSQSQGKSNPKPKNPIPFTKILPFLMFGLVLLISLIIIIKLCYKRKKIK